MFALPTSTVCGRSHLPVTRKHEGPGCLGIFPQKRERQQRNPGELFRTCDNSNTGTRSDVVSYVTRRGRSYVSRGRAMCWLAMRRIPTARIKGPWSSIFSIFSLGTASCLPAGTAGCDRHPNNIVRITHCNFVGGSSVTATRCRRKVRANGRY